MSFLDKLAIWAVENGIVKVRHGSRRFGILPIGSDKTVARPGPLFTITSVAGVESPQVSSSNAERTINLGVFGIKLGFVEIMCWPYGFRGLLPLDGVK